MQQHAKDFPDILDFPIVLYNFVSHHQFQWSETKTYVKRIYTYFFLVKLDLLLK